jgi:hypothetical protein
MGFGEKQVGNHFFEPTHSPLETSTTVYLKLGGKVFKKKAKPEDLPSHINTIQLSGERHEV